MNTLALAPARPRNQAVERRVQAHPAPAAVADPTLEPAPAPAPVRDFSQPDAAALCANLARSVIEILAGARPLEQIARWVDDAVYVQLLRRTMLTARSRAAAPTSSGTPRRPRMSIGDPNLSFPAEGVVEGVVMVHQPGRSRAVAVRLELHRDRWRASAITVL